MNWSRLRKRYLRQVLILMAALLLITYYLTKGIEDDFDWTNISDEHDLDQSNSHRGIGGCVYPKLKLWPAGLKDYYIKQEPPSCNDNHEKWITINNGVITYAGGVSTDVHCVYIPVYRGQDDITIYEGKSIPLSRDNPVKLTSEVGYAKCTKSSFLRWKTQTDIFLTIPEAEPPNANPIAQHEQLNILIMGFDSTSKLAWLRNLPKTHSYFTSVLDGVHFDTFNIVADGTTGNILGMLAGEKESDLYDTRKGVAGTDYVDNFPWIWNELKQSGYKTLLVEDDPEFGMFTYRMKGFKKSPVDYNGKPFYKLAQALGMHGKRSLCIGAKSKVQHITGFHSDFFDSHKSLPKVSFSFVAEYSHDSPNILNQADDELLKSLKTLKSQGHLDNTLVIMMADHGSRYGRTRRFMQGRYEERLPYLGIALPTLWANKYPEAAKNLKANSQKLVTSFDIHATIMDLLHGKKPYGNHYKTKWGSSLFGNISPNRTCTECGVDPHWCVCLEWTSVNRKSPSVIEAVDYVISSINTFLEPVKDKCSMLHLSQINKASVYSANKNMLNFERSVIENNRDYPIFTPTSENKIRYFLLFSTSPNNGMYEASLGYDAKSKHYDINVNTVSRTNAYGSQPSCLAGAWPRLDKFCYCK